MNMHTRAKCGLWRDMSGMHLKEQKTGTNLLEFLHLLQGHGEVFFSICTIQMSPIGANLHRRHPENAMQLRLALVFYSSKSPLQ
jgi:hypothetical protein